MIKPVASVSDIAERQLGSRMANKSETSMLNSLGKRLSGKGLGRAASILAGPVVGLASEAANASELGRDSDVMDEARYKANIARMLSDEPRNALAKSAKDKRSRRMEEIYSKTTPEALLEDRKDVNRIKQEFDDSNLEDVDLERLALDRLNEQRRKEGEFRDIRMSQLDDSNFKPIK
jgi:hypothetical protein